MVVSLFKDIDASVFAGIFFLHLGAKNSKIKIRTMNPNAIRKLVIIAFLVQGLVVYSYSPSKAIDFLHHKVWTMEDGLPINSLNSITQSADGYLWIGSEGGLIRFDGVKFDVFNHENVPFITGDIVSAVLEDKQGTLWVATRGDGVIRRQNGTFDAFTEASGLLSNQVSCLLESSDGLIWLGTRGGLNLVKEGTLSPVSLPETLTTTWITCLMEDKQSRVWVGTFGDGVLMLQYRDNELECEPVGPPGIKVTTLLEDRNNIVWIGSREKGLIRYEPDRFTFFTTKNGLSVNYVSCLYEDRSGNLWIGTQGGGIDLLAEEKQGLERGSIISPLPLRQEFPCRMINAIYKDREGTAWIATLGGGLNSLRETKIHTYNTRNGLSTDNVYGVFQDSGERLWVGSRDAGANYLKDNRFFSLTTKDGLSSQGVASFAEAPEGVIWFGTLGGGINRWKDGHIDVFGEDQGVPCDFVRAIIADADNRVWAGTVDGHILHFNNETFHLLVNLNYRVNTLYKDRNGNLWAGTFDKGLYRIHLKTGDIDVFDITKGLSHNTILCIHEDERQPDILWIGTIKGLNRYQAGKFATLYKKDGLPDDTAYWILEDHKHDFWISSNRGIYRLKYKETEAFLNGTLPAVHPVLYGIEAGMRSIECNGGNHPAGWKTQDGKLWFPTTHGLSVIDPVNVSVNRIPPPLAIKKITVNGIDTPVTETVLISPEKNDLEIYYTALSFIDPKKIQFKFIMEGYETEWKDTQERWVRYTNLPAGKYRFRVTACNSDGVWNEAGVSVQFRLKSKFYQTPVFIGVTLLGTGMIFLFLFLYFKKSSLRQKIEQKLSRSTLDPDQTRQHVQKLLYLLEVEKVFKDANISLKILASRLLISPKNLSYIINDQLNTTFFELITQYRMKEAQRILTDPCPKTRSVLDIAYDVGYNSKSAFNRAFKNFTSMTPSQYRKKATSERHAAKSE